MVLLHNKYGDSMLKKFYRMIVDNKVPTLASAIAFNIILNGGSILFLYLIVSNSFDNSYITSLIDSLENSKLKELISYFIDYQNNLKYSFFLIITSIYSASSLYYHFVNVTELLIKRPCPIGILKRIGAIVLTTLFLIGVNILVVLIFRIIRIFGIKLDIGFILLMISVVSIVLLILNIISIREFNLKKIYKGFLFSLGYSILFTIGFIFYIRRFSNFKIIYGVLSFVFVFCFYIYSLCIGFLIGICINNKNKLII